MLLKLKAIIGVLSVLLVLAVYLLWSSGREQTHQEEVEKKFFEFKQRPLKGKGYTCC